ncbi:GNAT family N-acetyltransferase [Myroides sp. LoEW2-1]|uniref:GNAT family N-acetyltransferase n=1 Tax=Myroides sp. LoEW2-1 TaxID=2683192 RepID=UPI001FB73D90|nr:GNAT family N-acetyltransferase [Myroides sp. LoEW2-1]
MMQKTLNIQDQPFQLSLLDEGDQYPYELLLLADETKEAIDKYLFHCDVYILTRERKVYAVFCLFKESDNVVELKNIAVDESLQGKGVGSILIKEIISIVKKSNVKTLIVGTADCGDAQIRFYERNGFVKYGVRKNFFIENYTLPIVENGVQLVDMVMLKMEL